MKSRKLQDKEGFYEFLLKCADDEASPHYSLAIEASMPGVPRSQYAMYGHLCHTFGEEQVRAAMLDFEKASR
jgi:hypothetical protein